MAELTLVKTAAEEQLAQAWDAARGRLPGPALPREEAFRRFARAGLPHRRVEEWKYTDLRALMRQALPLAGSPDAAAEAMARQAGAAFAGIDARRLVLIDGAFVPELSDLAAMEPGLTIGSLAAALAAGDAAVAARLAAGSQAERDPAFALNTAFMGDGVVVRVADGARIERPLHVVALATGGASYQHSLVTVGEGAALTLVESFEGPDGADYQVNAALDIVVGAGAEVARVKLGREGARALHIATLTAEIGARAKFDDFVLTAGGAVTRNQAFVRLDGAHSELGLRGASLLRGRQHADNTLVVDHAAGHCVSREVFKSVLDGDSRGVFQGKIIVRPGAQKTDGRMAANALLLSETAEADAKPELEIFADDVQCGHGATAGALDEDLRFYLEARGIPPKEAEALLIQAFIGTAVEPVAHEGLRDALMAVAVAWLQARG